MAEVDPVFPREWLDIPDQTGLARVYRCDLTWLTSHWNCVYGYGCPGTRKQHQGCCTVGAHWSGSKDRQRVEACALRLPGELWQFREIGQAEGITVADDDGSHGRTRIVEGACIFLNRDGFPAGPGCALHLLALAEGRPPLETKPDVCWQIPLRLSYAWESVGEADTLIVTVGEYDRTAWGPGGAYMNWWCSSNTEAHTAARPLYQTYAGELTALIGSENYQELARVCDERCQSPGPPRPHPADTSAQVILPIPSVPRPQRDRAAATGKPVSHALRFGGEHVPRELTTRGDAELGEDVAEVELDRLAADIQLARVLLVGHALRHQARHPVLFSQPNSRTS